MAIAATTFAITLGLPNATSTASAAEAVAGLRNVRITNVNSGLSLDDRMSSLDNGNPIIQYFDNASAAQRWNLLPVDGAPGYYWVVSQQSGKCLSVDQSSLDAGANLLQWDCISWATTMQWKLSKVGTNYTFTNRRSGKLLDVPGSSKEIWQKVWQWPANGTAAQLFSVTEMGAAGYTSGQGMPVGDLPGWKQIYTEDFNVAVGLGSFPGPYYTEKWHPYDEGTPDTQHVAVDSAQRTLSVNNGALDMYIRTENGVSLVAAVVARLPTWGQRYGRYTVRYRADEINTYDAMWLLWPDSEKFPDHGEIDWPEGPLHMPPFAFAHYASPTGGQDGFQATETMKNWHTATTEWMPGKLTFLMDGKVIGVSTTHVPSEPMHYVFQAGGWGPPLDKNASGHIQVDWVSIYAPA